VSAYVDEHRTRFGVEPICRTLGVSASAYYERRSGRRSARQVEDERLLARIRELHAANYCAYGYRRMWLSLKRARERVGRGRVQRLMRQAGIQGAKRRGRPWRTTTPDPEAPAYLCGFSTRARTWRPRTSSPPPPVSGESGRCRKLRSGAEREG
jgi:putative transposase